MSRTIEALKDGTFHEEIIDFDRCRWEYDGVCCNDKSDYVADFPSDDVCEKCSYFERETVDDENIK